MKRDEVSYYCDTCKKTIIEHGEMSMNGNDFIVYQVHTNEYYNHYCSEECLFQGIKKEFEINHNSFEIYRFKFKAKLR